MKNGFSVELKIIFTAVVVLLALFTAVVVMQVFRNNNEIVSFVYNSARTEAASEVNIFDIFPKI